MFWLPDYLRRRIRNGPAEFAPPGTRTTRGVTSWPTAILAHAIAHAARANPATRRGPAKVGRRPAAASACLEGWVFLGSNGPDGEEVYEALLCRRCGGKGQGHSEDC